MKTKLVLIVVAGSLLSACNGSVHSKLWTPDALRDAMSGEAGIKGVIGYFPRSVLESDEFTQVVDKDGKLVTSDCNHVVIQKITTIADEAHPTQVWYEPGFLEANQFGAQWAGGIFTAVNSQSSPDQGKTLSNIASAATNFAKLGVAGAVLAPPSPPGTPGKPNCNGAPTLKRLDPVSFPAPIGQ